VLAFDDSGNVTVALLASGSAASAAKLYIAYDKLDPSKVTADDIIGGKTAAGVETGLELIRQIYPMLNVNAGLITAPTWSKNAAVAAVMEAKCSSINGCFDSESVVDIDSTVTKLYSDVETGKGTLGVTGTHSIVCWPMWHENNKVISLSAVAAARMTATDMANDQVPYKSPSNKSLGDEGYACLEDGTKVLLDQEQANVINGVGVVTALNLRGFVLWGNNTAAYPSSKEAKDRWISVRRFFTWWTNRFINTYIKRIDENVSRRMVETIVDDENIVCNGYVARGYVPGASISVDYDNSVFADGKLVFSEKIGAYPPAESITNKVSCDTSYLQSEFGGES
jgi:phage tail sheath protein FI